MNSEIKSVDYKDNLVTKLINCKYKTMIRFLEKNITSIRFRDGRTYFTGATEQ